MDRMDYTQAVATMRVYEKRLLDQIKIERMVEADSAEDVLKILQETEYSRSIPSGTRPEDFEEVLSNELTTVYADINGKIKDPAIIAVLALRYDYQNLKTLLKAEALGEGLDLDLSNMGTVPAQAMRSEFEAGSLKDAGAQFQAAAEAARDEFSKSQDPQQMDFVLDRAYYAHIGELLEGLDVDMIQDYVRYQIDSYNLLALMRTRKQEKDPRFIQDVVVPGGQIEVREILDSASDAPEQIGARFLGRKVGPALKRGVDEYLSTGRLGELERQLENGLMDLVRPARTVVFGPEPLFGYVVAKERENKLLRIIFVSKLNNIPPDRIRERLRDIYV